MRRPGNSNRTRPWNSVRWVALAALVGCGGTTTFQDTTPIRVAIAPAPPPPAPAEAPQKKVVIRDKRIEISEKIQFALDKADILPASFSLLDEVAKVIQDNPHVKQVSIEGHASAEGDDRYNLSLSQARAEAVRAYLVGKGVEAARLTSTGYGETRPLASNDTMEGREKNRRVEFHITKQDPIKQTVEIDPATGEERIVKSSMNTEGSK